MTAQAAQLEKSGDTRKADELRVGADRLTAQNSLQNSFAGKIGHVIEPVIAPLGFDWQIGIGIFSSFAAREVIVSTLAVVYGVGEDAAENNPSSLYDSLRRANARMARRFSPPRPARACWSFTFSPRNASPPGRRPPRDEQLEMAAVPDRLHDRARVRRRLHRFSNLQPARALKLHLRFTIYDLRWARSEKARQS